MGVSARRMPGPAYLFARIRTGLSWFDYGCLRIKADGRVHLAREPPYRQVIERSDRKHGYQEVAFEGRAYPAPVPDR